MIDTDTACVLLEGLCSAGDQIWLMHKGEAFPTTPRDLGMNSGFNHRIPANKVSVQFFGGARDGSSRIKTGTLFTMVMDRITFG